MDYGTKGRKPQPLADLEGTLVAGKALLVYTQGMTQSGNEPRDCLSHGLVTELIPAATDQRTGLRTGALNPPTQAQETKPNRRNVRRRPCSVDCPKKTTPQNLPETSTKNAWLSASEFARNLNENARLLKPRDLFSGAFLTQ